MSFEHDNMNVTDSGAPESSVLYDDCCEGTGGKSTGRLSYEEAGAPEPERKDVLHYDPEAYARKPLKQGEYKPDPAVLVLREFCVNGFGGSCDRCVRACPMGCIELGEDGIPRIDRTGCTLCGICLGVCDAFTSNDVTMADLASRIRRASYRGEGVVITCPMNLPDDFEPAGNVVQVPCLAALSPEFWALALAQGIELTIAADLDLCEDCVRGGNVAEPLYTHAIETAQNWTEREIALIDVVPSERGLVGDFVSEGHFDRRGAFAHVAGSVADVTSGEYRRRNSSVLQDFYERRDRMRAITRLVGSSVPEVNRFAAAGVSKRKMLPKRQLLAEAVDALPAMGEQVWVSASVTDEALCENCLDCTRSCLTSARLADASTGKLAYDVHYCMGCGLCVGACSRGAVSMRDYPARVLVNQPTEGE